MSSERESQLEQLHEILDHQPIDEGKLEELFTLEPSLREDWEVLLEAERELRNSCDEETSEGLHGRIMESLRATEGQQHRKRRLYQVVATAAAILLMVMLSISDDSKVGTNDKPTVQVVEVNDQPLEMPVFVVNRWNPTGALKAKGEALARSAETIVTSPFRILPSIPLEKLREIQPEETSAGQS